jgi:hypothetical protein
MNPLLQEKLEASPTEAGLANETSENFQLAFQALSDPDAHIWPTLLKLLTFMRRLETMQDCDQYAPTRQTIQILNECKENELLREEFQQLVCKLAARWLSRAIQNGLLTLDQLELELPPDSLGPYDPAAEPWLAALISRCFVE